MTTATAIELNILCEQAVYPPYDRFHGTPHAMLWRRVSIETPHGTAAFEQTDYGHPGKLNPWQPRGIPPPLVAKLPQLQALVEDVSALL
jgi:hypothetical protein